jgi:hypothetical protein
VIKSVKNYPVSQISDIEAGVDSEIPHYQREYTWKSLFAIKGGQPCE